MNFEHVFLKRRNILFTERVEKLLLVLIGWQAYRGDQRHRKKQPYITLKSNPSKEKKHLPGQYTFKTPLTADFGQIWILEKQVPGLLEMSNFV